MTPEIEHPGWPRLYVWTADGQWWAAVVDETGRWLWSAKEAVPELLGRDGMIAAARRAGYVGLPIIEARHLRDVPRRPNASK